MYNTLICPYILPAALKWKEKCSRYLVHRSSQVLWTTWPWASYRLLVQKHSGAPDVLLLDSLKVLAGERTSNGEFHIFWKCCNYWREGSTCVSHTASITRRAPDFNNIAASAANSFTHTHARTIHLSNKKTRILNTIIVSVKWNTLTTLWHTRRHSPYSGGCIFAAHRIWSQGW